MIMTLREFEETPIGQNLKEMHLYETHIKWRSNKKNKDAKDVKEIELKFIKPALPKGETSSKKGL